MVAGTGMLLSNPRLPKGVFHATEWIAAGFPTRVTGKSEQQCYGYYYVCYGYYRYYDYDYDYHGYKYYDTTDPC